MRNLLFIISILFAVNSFAQSIDNKPRVFNVKNFGAKGDSTTDDTQSIQKAINVCDSSGGGVVYFPNGIYIINGNFITSLNSVNPNCQLYIPLTTESNVGIAPSVKLMGETPPNFNVSGLTAWNRNHKGAVLLSLKTGSGTTPYIIGSSWAVATFGNYNFTQVTIENLTIRAKSKANDGSDTATTVGGVDLSHIETVELENVMIDNQSPDFTSTKPVSTTIGLNMPVRNNDAWSQVNEVLVAGYGTGIVATEHMSGDNIFISACINGIAINATQNHLISFDHILISWCTNNIVGSGGASALNILNLVIEDYNNSFGTRWYLNTYDINDSSNFLSGAIWYRKIISSVGLSQTLVLNGGTGISKNSLSKPPVFQVSEGIRMIGGATTLTTGTALGAYGNEVEINSGVVTSGDSGFADLILSNNQTGTNNIIGRLIFVNPQSTISDKRLAEIYTTTDGTKNKGRTYIMGNNGSSLNTIVQFTGDLWQFYKMVGINTTPVTDQLEISGNMNLVTAGNKIKIATGTNASVGVSGAMTAGTITISTTAVTASSKIFLTYATVGGTQGFLSVGTITDGTSFVINSSSALDTSTVNWWIIN